MGHPYQYPLSSHQSSLPFTMTTLKQVLVAVAAAVVSVCATPLLADDTATSVVGAPVSAVTKISKALEGKELEVFLAGWPYTPEGSVDITNTTLATELIKFHDAHSTGLVKRSGACDQGDCPDFSAAFDWYEQHWVIAMGETYANYWAYIGRWNDCGQCGTASTSADGCFDFTSCGRPQNICIDIGNMRSHRIYKDTGGKHCYKLKREYYGNCGPALVASRISRPIEKVACNW